MHFETLSDFLERTELTWKVDLLRLHELKKVQKS